jgi:hypothetical protein
MAQKTIFLDDRGNNKSNDQLEIFANTDGLLTITMEDTNDDFSYACIQLTKENALELVKHIQNEIELL